MAGASRFPARCSTGRDLHSRSEQTQSPPLLALCCGHLELLARHYERQLSSVGSGLRRVLWGRAG